MFLTIFAVIVILFFVMMTYNSLVSKRNNVDNAFAGIDAQLKKRCDLIPNLVETVKNYTKHENSTFAEITELRSKALSPGLSEEERDQVETRLGGALKSLMVQVEAYPELKASENFQHLQRTLTEVEEQLSAARRAYNASVNEYNNAVQMFPSNIFAGMFGFTVRRFFEASEEDRRNPDVGSLFKK